MPYIYCLSNPAMPGLIKLGAVHINDKNVTDRANELYTTGVPDKFNIEFFAEVEDSRGIERKIHDILDEYRNNASREFFRIKSDEAKYIIEQNIPELKWSKDEPLTNNNKSTYNRLSELHDTILNDTRSFIKKMELQKYYDGPYENKNERKCEMLIQRLGYISDGLSRMNTKEALNSPFKQVDNWYMKKELNSIKDDLDTFKKSIDSHNNI